jgi:predicted DNA-binding protein
MLCVRVPASLRRRLKLLSVQTGRPLQQLAAAALEAECRRHGA